jgi:integrase
MDMGRLSAAKVKGALAQGRYADGGGLYLQVKPSGARSWLYRYKVAGKPKYMGLGPYPEVSLAEARAKATEARKLRVDGRDPIAQKRAQTSARAEGVTFEDAAKACIAARRAEWRSTKTAYIWEHTLKAYAFPIMGALPVAAIELLHVKDALAPVRMTKPETGRRLRRQIASVLDYAKAHGWRSGDNPAAESLIDSVMAKPKGAPTHHPAMHWRDLPVFYARIAELEDLSAIAMRVVILTACRTGEALGATWGEVDLKEKVWTIAAARMKGLREHRVPLSAEAVGAFEAAQAFRLANSDYVFPGARIGRPLSNMAMLALLRRLKVTGVTTHGFRSTFRDFIDEQTDFPPHVAEMCLAHSIGSAVEKAYRRSDLFQRRAEAMRIWAAHCESEAI